MDTHPTNKGDGAAPKGELSSRLRVHENHIKVVCRVRPSNKRETGLSLGQKKCITVQDSAESLLLNTRPEPKTFSFDYVADESVGQEAMFELVGRPITHTCLEGFNGTIICYGQTGSGKSHTIFGETSGSQEGRGLVPRVLEYLWRHMDSVAGTSYRCKCSFYEIYQERVFDLLDAGSSGSLLVREDSKVGVHVEGILEVSVASAVEVASVLEKGTRNRHIGETAMNRESSRSHAVFTLVIDAVDRDESGLSAHRQSRFSLVDLAGSERQRDTSATGERLKEAGVINKSLSALGNVIKALSERHKSDPTKQQHIHYRDSKLTFLLRDSIGGNAKTVLVATVSPAETSMAETLSTLQFAQRAKRIQNTAVVNEDVRGNVAALQRELLLLRSRLAAYQGSADRCPATHIASDETPLDLATSPYLDLPTQALIRCRAMEDEKARAEDHARALQERLAQYEKIPLALKMQLKMRDAEISRLRGIAPMTPIVAEEVVRAEVDAVREHMLLELLQLRAKCEESDRRFLSLLAMQGEGADASAGGWSQSKENVFTLELFAKLEEVETRYNEMLDRLEVSGGARFEEAFGFTLAEARSLRSIADAATSRAQEAEVMLSVHREENEGLARRLALAEEAASDASMHSSMAVEEERVRVAEARLAVSLLERDVREKDETIAGLLDATRHTVDAEKQSVSAKDFEHKRQLNKAMKDNAILISVNQRLERDMLSKSAMLVARDREVEELRAAHATHAAEALTKVQSVSAQLMDAEERAIASSAERDEALRQVDELTDSAMALETESCELEERLRAAEERGVGLAREIEKLNFDIDNANETNDNLYVQTEQLLQERLAFVEAVRAADERCDGLRAANDELLLAARVSAEVSEARVADLLKQGAEAREEEEERERDVLERLAEYSFRVAALVSENEALSLSCASLEKCLGEQRDATAEELKAAECRATALGKEVEDAKTREISLQSQLADACAAVHGSDAKSIVHELRVRELQVEVEALRTELIDVSARGGASSVETIAAELEGMRCVIAALQSERQELYSRLKCVQEEKEELSSTAQSKGVIAQVLESDKRRLAAELERAQEALDTAHDELELRGKVVRDESASEEASARVLQLLERVRLQAAREDELKAALLEAESRLERGQEGAASVTELTQALSGARREINAKNLELSAVLSKHAAEMDVLRSNVEHANSEMARLTGQHNNKQRIQLHMKLKKELEDQAVQIKQQQAVINELMHEREAAREEARRHRHMGRDAALGALGSTNSSPRKPVAKAMDVDL